MLGLSEVAQLRKAEHFEKSLEEAVGEGGEGAGRRGGRKEDG